MRALRAEHPDAEITASDLMDDAVNFCAETFGAIPAVSNEDVSQISFPEPFDLIWVGSVFTHLNAQGFRRLLARLVEFLAPDGLLVFTVHGRTALWIFENQKLHKGPVAQANFAALKDSFYKEGFGFMEYNPNLIALLADQRGAKVSQGSYGFSCCRTEWVCREIGEHPAIKLLSYHEGGWSNNHDVVTVQRPAVLRV
jgi:SAM-dependent methyltransferase